MRYPRILLYFIASLSLGFLGCNAKEETTTATDPVHYYDPRIPGGQIIDNGGLAGKVLGLTADASVLEQITLKWTVPPVYKTMNYEVKIYKKKGSDTTFVLPDPADQYSAAPLYLYSTVVADSFLDQNGVNSNNEVVVNVEQNQIYTYWVYIHLLDNDKWSAGTSIVVTSKTPEDTFSFPSVATFWDNLLNTLGSKPTPDSNPLISVSTMSAGLTSVDSPTGGIAVAYSGNVLYYADTANNRVVIYTRGLAYKCDDYKTSDPALYYACVYQYTGLPLSAVGVIGQDKVGSDGFNASSGKRTCAQHETICSAITSASSCDPNVLGTNSICEWVSNNALPNGGSCTAYKRCLTAPSKVTVADDRLFISDAGNNRVVVYYNQITATNKQTLPVKGHVKDNGSGTSLAIDSGPVKVIGKKGLIDQTISYPVGKSSLKNPGGVAVLGSDLYVADTGNNRVVKIKNYKTDYDCETSSGDWGNLPTDAGYAGGKCRFSYLLGQRTFFERWAFKEGAGTLGPGDVGYDGIQCTNPTPTSTYCDSPYILYNQSCGSNSTIASCGSISSCNWISSTTSCSENHGSDIAGCNADLACGWDATAATPYCAAKAGSCSLKAEATLRDVFDQQNPNKSGQFMARYFRAPSDIAFTTYKNVIDVNETALLVTSNEEATITSPLGTSQLRGRVLVWRTNPFPDIDTPPSGSTLCYAGHPYDNFDISLSRCHADFVIGQQNFNQLSIVSSGGDYGSLTIGLKALTGIAVKNKMLFGVDGSNNKVYFWQDFTNTLTPGIPPSATVLNPNGRINANTGTYLPVLQGLSSIGVTDNNLIYISDPANNKVYEIRAYNYETAQ